MHFVLNFGVTCVYSTFKSREIILYTFARDDQLISVIFSFNFPTIFEMFTNINGLWCQNH